MTAKAKDEPKRLSMHERWAIDEEEGFGPEPVASQPAPKQAEEPPAQDKGAAKT